MVLYILTGYWVLGTVYLDQLSGVRPTHIFYHGRKKELKERKQYREGKKEKSKGKKKDRKTELCVTIAES